MLNDLMIKRPLNWLWTPILISALTVAMLVIVFLEEPLFDLSLPNLCRFSTLLMTVMVWLVYLYSTRGIWSASFIYVSVFCLFHFGLIIVLGLTLPLPPDLAFIMDAYWPALSSIKGAVLLVDIGLVAYVTGIVSNNIISSIKPLSPWKDTAATFTILARTGFAILVGAIFIWLVKVLASGGISVLLGSYREFLTATEDESLSILYFLIGLGLVLLTASGPSPLRKRGYAIFVMFSIAALPLGLRGEVLFSACAALTAASMQSIPCSTKNAILFAVIGLCAIAAIREIRQVGVIGGKPSVASISPHNALAEMGGSLRPVAVVYSWAARGEEYLYGASFWAPLDRALYYVIPGWDRVDARNDNRLLNIVIQERVSPIGFSPVAEGHRNWGLPGVVIIMFIIGFVLARIEQRAYSRLEIAKVGVIMLVLLVFVRNAFTQVPFQLLFSFFIIYLVKIISRQKVEYR